MFHGKMWSVGSARWGGRVDRRGHEGKIYRVHNGRRRMAHVVSMTWRAGRRGELPRVKKIGDDFAAVAEGE